MAIQWFGQTLHELPKLFQRVKPPAGEVLRVRVRSWVLGAMTVHVKPGYEVKQKPAIGLEIDRIDKPDSHHFWALVGQEPVAQLEPELTTGAALNSIISISARGSAIAKHWTIAVEPAIEVAP